MAPAFILLFLLPSENALNSGETASVGICPGGGGESPHSGTRAVTAGISVCRSIVYCDVDFAQFRGPVSTKAFSFSAVYAILAAKGSDMRCGLLTM